MLSGVRIAFDIGKARIGVATTDKSCILATPREYVERHSQDSETVKLLLQQIAAAEAVKVFVGLPVNLRNESTPSTEDAVTLATALQAGTAVPIHLLDERLTTKIASGRLQSAGLDTRQQRGLIDSQSAALMLELALQLEKSNQQAGILVSEYEA